MTEKRSEVKTIMVDAMCTHCDQGQLFAQEDTPLTTSPAKWLHKCNRCGIVEIFNVKYPRIEYVRI